MKQVFDNFRLDHFMSDEKIYAYLKNSDLKISNWILLIAY
jgi:hypothetical protein